MCSVKSSKDDTGKVSYFGLQLDKGVKPEKWNRAIEACSSGRFIILYVFVRKEMSHSAAISKCILTVLIVDQLHICTRA